MAAAAVATPRRAEVSDARRWIPAYIGLGSNLDDPARQIEAAFAGLATLPDSRLLLRSRAYRTRPVGPQDQPDFVNAAAALLTRLEAAELHGELKALEQRLGKRPPPVRFGPRRIDLDLLVYGASIVATTDLTVPHPRLHERAFVLYPLDDMAPALWIPGRGRVATLRAAVAGDAPTPL